jgi:prophage DNA circulation protein
MFSSAFGGAWGAAKGAMMGVIDSIKGAVQGLMDWISAKISQIMGVLTGAVNKVKSLGSGAINLAKSVVGVNDAIISPKGDIITTHPDDYIIATKNPKSLGGGGGVNITITGNTLLDSRGAEQIGEMLMKTLRRNVIPA